VQAQIVVVLYGKMVFMEIAFQNSCRLCSIRECKPDMLTAFLLQFSKAFFFQQCAVVDNSNIVSQQGNLRKNVTGNQNGFSSCVAKLPNKGAYFCNTDRIETVDWFIQNQKFWIVHNGKGDGKPLLHTKRILRKEFFIFVGKSYQIQSIFDGMIVWYTPQSSKNTQVFCAGQIGIKTGGLNQAADTGQQFLFIPL